MSGATCQAIFESMYLIRGIEEGIASRYASGKMRCPTHLSIGQECVPAVLSVLLDMDNDQAVSTHRAHAHYLAKGGDPKRLIAELYGKSTGCSGGFGGSMHLIDRSVGFMGSTAIVGGTIPTGVGLALAKSIKKEQGVVVVYLGDGAIEEGSFYESANFAAVKKLPVLFVCENNRYSVYSSLECRQPLGRKITDVANGIGLKSWCGDGNDPLQCHSILSEALALIRSGEGPAFVELETYRWREHCGPNYDDHLNYRDEAEVQSWRERDPVLSLEKLLLKEHLITEELIEVLKSNVIKVVEESFDFAENSPFPNPKNSSHVMYA
ncbi:acetoin dehydrogenase [Oleiphilus sp. HI0117]|nr:acetoin dehydrogenase [Oleiphilus sp. HI0117]KZZ54155.1 acetoin dehydrogenase [Oleiphilus sp. HI0123]